MGIGHWLAKQDPFNLEANGRRNDNDKKVLVRARMG